MVKSINYATQGELLQALRSGTPAAFESLYRQYYRMVAKQTADAGRSSTEAEDLFQEVLVILVRKIRDPEFQLSAQLSTYLFAIARNLLLKKKDPATSSNAGDPAALRLEEEDQTEDIATRARLEAQLNVVAGQLELLDEDCQRVLKLSFYEKRPQTEIASVLGYTEAFVKVKKHRCLDYLRKKVKAQPLFKHAQNDN